MPIEFQCSQCSKVLRVPDGSAGKKAKCPSCAAIVEVPAAAAPPAEDDEYKVAPPEPSPGPQAGVNPFADGKGTNPFAEKGFDPKNPYASPSYSSVGKPGRPSSDERRTGPPWERDGKSVNTFFATVKEVFGQTTSTFATMRREGGFGAPMGFAIAGQMIGAAAMFVFQFIMEAAMGAAAGGDPEVLGIQAATYCGVFVCMPVLVIISLFVQSFILHLMLMLVGGTDRGFDTFETTFRVVSYVGGATSLLLLIPVCGQWIQAIVGLVFTIMGIAAAHETTAGKAVLAVLMPMIICCVSVVVIVFVVGFMAAAAGAAG